MAFQQSAVDTYLEKTVTVKNLTDHPLYTKWDGKPFVLGSKAEEQLPMWLAKHLVRQFDSVNVHGNIEKWVEVIENVNFSCGSCSKTFETRRELGGHSLVHKNKE